MRVLALCLTSVMGVDVVAAQDAAPPLSCEVVVRSSDNGSGRFGSVAPGRDGRLAWTDGQPGQFILRDAAGKIRFVGRQGAGPGEFSRPGSMNWIGDTLWVGDYRLNRVQFFSDTGRLIRVATAMLPGNWGASRDGRLVGFKPVGLGMTEPFAVVSHVVGSTRLDTLRTFPVVEVDRLEVPLRDESVAVPQPLAAQTVIGFNEEFTRFCAAVPQSSRLQLTCIDETGRLVADRALTLTPRPLPDAVYDSTIAFYLRVPGRTEDMMRSRVNRPRYLPLAHGLMVDPQGVVWLLRTSRYERTAIWTRVRSDGTILSDVAAPARMRIFRLDTEYFWAAQADDDGVETLHRCRLR